MGKKGRHAQAPDLFPFQLNEAGAGTRDLRPAKKAKSLAASNPWPLLGPRGRFSCSESKNLVVAVQQCAETMRGGSNGEVKDGMHAGPSGGFVLKHTNLLPSGPH